MSEKLPISRHDRVKSNVAITAATVSDYAMYFIIHCSPIQQSKAFCGRVKS